MKKINLNRKLFAIHSWLGLFLGVLFFLISLGGASIVFYHELTQLLYGSHIQYQAQPRAKLSYDQLYALGKKMHPQASFIGITTDYYYPENAPCIVYSDHDPVGLFELGYYYSDYVNPYSGELIYSTDNTFRGNIIQWLDSLHASLRLGAGGAFIVGVMSVALLLSLITGVIVYRKSIWKALTFRIKIKFKNWRTASSDLHRVIGIWSLIVNLMIFGSGLYMYYALLTPTWWKENWPPKKMEMIVPEMNVSLDSLVAKAAAMIPQWTPVSVAIMHDTSRMVYIYGQKKERLYLAADNYASVAFTTSGQLKETNNRTWNKMSFTEKFDDINFNFFHTGWALGTPGKIIWTMGGFTPAFLGITGFMLWWRRQKKSIKRG